MVVRRRAPVANRKGLNSLVVRHVVERRGSCPERRAGASRGQSPLATGWRIAAANASITFGLAGQASTSLSDAPAEIREAVEENTVGFLNDLSGRRRTTTLFPNPQPVFSGVQESFINTSIGSMTFLARDLVRVGGMPIVMGRVYDSALEEGGDFGPGWKLTVVEEVRQEGSQLLFTDASNGVHRLDVSGDTVTPESPATAPIISGSTRTTGGEAGIVVLESADGMLRRFKRDGDVWRLVHVRHGRGWARIEWRRGTLTPAGCASRAATTAGFRRSATTSGELWATRTTRTAG